MSKSFAVSTNDALAMATAAAAQKLAQRQPTSSPAPRKKAGKKVQFNIQLDVQSRQKLKAVAFAWRTTERELVESFIEQLPHVEVPQVAAPAAVVWAKPGESRS